MKSIRTLLTFVLFASLAVFQLPSSVSCQMRLGLPTFSCKMPCCKKTTVPVRCPLLKTQAPRDAIAASPVHTPPLVSSAWLAGTFEVRPPLHARAISFAVRVVRLVFHHGPPPARSPPSYVILLNA
jgi:hypothetical protein